MPKESVELDVRNARLDRPGTRLCYVALQDHPPPIPYTLGSSATSNSRDSFVGLEFNII